jgi:transketolase
MSEPQIDVGKLQEMARGFRLDVLDMTTRYQGHLSSCYSAVEIMTALYFGGVMRYCPEDAHWPERDRCILSKGHAAPLLYTVLAHAGFFELSRLAHFREIGDNLHGHPIQDSLPGVELTSGSLGQGLSFGLGHVLARRLSGLDYFVYVVMGDGECQAGQVWEAAMAAAHLKANQLIAIIDHNKYQQTGPISREMSLGSVAAPFADKWRSFGWYVQECNGHHVGDVVSALRRAREIKEQPVVVIAHTVKGKGISFVEADYGFHGRGLSPEQAGKGREEILCHSVN